MQVGKVGTQGEVVVAYMRTDTEAGDVMRCDQMGYFEGKANGIRCEV